MKLVLLHVKHCQAGTEIGPAMSTESHSTPMGSSYQVTFGRQTRWENREGSPKEENWKREDLSGTAIQQVPASPKPSSTYCIPPALGTGASELSSFCESQGISPFLPSPLFSLPFHLSWEWVVLPTSKQESCPDSCYVWTTLTWHIKGFHPGRQSTSEANAHSPLLKILG